jgi:oligopeptide transport system ATP-binding protein
MTTPAIAVDQLRMYFPLKKSFFGGNRVWIRAVDGVSFTVGQGETLGLVGESGCGKSSLGRTLIRLYRPTAGSIQICGQDVSSLEGESLRKARVNFQMIFQDPYASLNPRMTVFDSIAEPFRTHGLVRNKEELAQCIASLMNKVGLSPRFIRKYPHEFSGGQRQRVAIARALAMNPKVIICDEPISALDVSIQAQILNLLVALQKELGLSYLFIAHDLAAVRYISSRVAVMYLGRIVELADKEKLFTHPRHPYTQALLSAVPIADPKRERARKRIILSGDLPSPAYPPRGCAFHTRCPYAQPLCVTETPMANSVEEGHVVVCHFAQGGLTPRSI